MEFTHLVDYHLHTSVTIDGKMDEKSACEKAISMGIHEIAFTNHVMLTQPEYTVSAASFQEHWKNIQDCQQRFPELTIRLGIEMDYYPDREEEIASRLESYERLIDRPFDIILGSVHEINGGFFSNKLLAPVFFEENDLISLYSDYFGLATMAAKSGLFDVIAHPDLIKKYTNELTLPVPFFTYRGAANAFVEALASHGVGLEVNTKGLKLAVQEAYPSDDLLNVYLLQTHSLGVQPIITLGSDAHKVDDVGYKISETIAHLADLGVNHLTLFELRHKSTLPIPRN